MMTPKRRELAFVAVGAAGFAVQCGVVVLLHRLGCPIVLASALSVIAAVVHNFVWHRCWTWADRIDGRGAVRRFLEFAGATGTISLVCNVAFVVLLARILPMHPLVAATVAVLAASVLNYTANDRFVFRGSR